ncbi:hybrid sensor histidine kinase/response regulator [Pseudoduganella violaceinigra]|uniref:hybrid sensor histidine kinase/response regulator n=1 Tax=Pseudoduganella violaceinigra TaxID=246602 RepID=UPI0003FFFF7B|nr:hybrid sensor histidine kinase/response regulator [Pseudoduganella violaceinigra]
MEPTNVLLVDDLPENLRALGALVRADDRVIYQARNGEEALALLLEHEFALAIVDVQMPGMDGFELAELMRGTGKTRHIPIVFVSAAGKELNYAFKGYEAGAVDFLYKPLDADAVKSKVNVFVDLYKQKQEVRQTVAQRDATVQELNAVQQELERALEMRDQFMSMVAHELRTPLNTLYLEAQMRKLQLERGNMDHFAPQQLERMVARDMRQIHAMVRLIDDMLDVSRIRSGKLSIRPGRVDLEALLQRIVGDLTHQATDMHTELRLSIVQRVAGCWDEFRLEQVIVNLITNALRYGDSKPVEVRLHADSQNARIEVSDQGPGIPEEVLPKIFEPFERGKMDTVSAGLGLGLYISRQLAEAHGGTLAVRSKPGEGSTFILTLPRPEQEMSPVGSGRNVDISKENVHICS